MWIIQHIAKIKVMKVRYKDGSGKGSGRLGQKPVPLRRWDGVTPQYSTPEGYAILPVHPEELLAMTLPEPRWFAEPYLRLQCLEFALQTQCSVRKGYAAGGMAG